MRLSFYELRLDFKWFQVAKPDRVTLHLVDVHSDLAALVWAVKLYFEQVLLLNSFEYVRLPKCSDNELILDFAARASVRIRKAG